MTHMPFRLIITIDISHKHLFILDLRLDCTGIPRQEISKFVFFLFVRLYCTFMSLIPLDIDHSLKNIVIYKEYLFIKTL